MVSLVIPIYKNEANLDRLLADRATHAPLLDDDDQNGEEDGLNGECDDELRTQSDARLERVAGEHGRRECTLSSRHAAHPLLEMVVAEALAVARAAGVEIPSLAEPKAAIAGAMKLLKQMGPATSSTAQDLARGKRTEIDSLNGYVSRKGAQLGVPTPVNYTLYTLVKLAEENL